MLCPFRFTRGLPRSVCLSVCLSVSLVWLAVPGWERSFSLTPVSSISREFTDCWPCGHTGRPRHGLDFRQFIMQALCYENEWKSYIRQNIFLFNFCKIVFESLVNKHNRVFGVVGRNVEMFLIPKKIVSFDKTSLEPRFFHSTQRTTVFRPSTVVTLEAELKQRLLKAELKQR